MDLVPRASTAQVPCANVLSGVHVGRVARDGAGWVGRRMGGDSTEPWAPPVRSRVRVRGVSKFFLIRSLSPIDYIQPFSSLIAEWAVMFTRASLNTFTMCVRAHLYSLCLNEVGSEVQASAKVQIEYKPEESLA